MIRVLRGPRPALRRALAPHLLPASSLSVEVTGALPLPWGGARACLAALRRRCGDAAVERALAPRRALLSLVLRGLEGALTPEERAERGRLEAQPLGFMSHSRMTAAPLLDAWIEALAPLVAGSAAAIVLPDAARVDPESVAMLRHLVRRVAPEARPDLILGFDTGEAPGGFLLRRSVDLVDIQLAMLEVLPGAVSEALPAPGSGGGDEGEGEPPLGAEPLVDPLDDRAEERALEALRRDPADPAAVAGALAAARAAFAAFGFTTSLSLGLEVLARCPSLSAAEAAEVHALVALSAYNRQIEAGDPRLTAFLEEHFGAALAAEEDAARRSHLLYRLSINAARRARDLDRGMALAARAIEEARRPGLPAALAGYLEAWARNGRAYMLGQARRHAEAAAECEAAYALAERAAAAMPPREILASRVVFLDNLAETTFRAGDRAGAARWQAALEEAEAALDPIMRTAPLRWAAILRAERRIGEAIRRAEGGLEAARRHLNPVMEERFAVALGDLWYRAGDAAAALAMFAAALPIRRRLGEAREIARAEIACAAAAMRGGQLDEAELLLGRALASPLCARPGARAEALAALGVVAALRGDGALFRRRMNDAIAQAVSAGERDALLRAARAAGQGSLALGRRGEAAEAFRRAAAIAAKPGGAPPRASDQLGVLVGLCDAGAGDDAAVAQALAIAPAALEDPEAWWQLPALLRGVAAAGGAARLGGAAAEAFAEVARAAAERVDCGPLLAALGAPGHAA